MHCAHHHTSVTGLNVRVTILSKTLMTGPRGVADCALPVFVKGGGGASREGICPPSPPWSYVPTALHSRYSKVELIFDVYPGIDCVTKYFFMAILIKLAQCEVTYF